MVSTAKPARFPGYRAFDTPRSRNMMVWVGAMVEALRRGAEVYSVRTRRLITL